MATISLGISATPAAGQLIEHKDKQYTTIKEGLAYILVPHTTTVASAETTQEEKKKQSVFYNPIQQFNRDLSVLAIRAFGEDVIERKKRYKQERGKTVRNKKKRKREADDVQGPALKRVDDSEMNGAANAETSQAGPEKVQEVANGVPEDTKVDPNNETNGQKDTVPTNGQQPSTIDEQNETTVKSPAFTILDALSATGLRALRYAQEIPFTTLITANDLLPAATASIRLNVEHNNLSSKINVNTGNALSHMYSLAEEPMDAQGRLRGSKKKYDVIDLDPYGTAAPFLDAAVQSVQDGGLLCVTCTDAGVWASNGYPEKSYSLYGGIPIKGLHSHEGGLRLILHAIASSAARYGIAIEPLLSLSIDFYARVFVRVKRSPAEVKLLAGKTMTVYNCDIGCGAWKTQLLARNKIAENKKGSGTFHKHVFAQGPSCDGQCEHCGTKMHLAGPMYAGPLHNPAFIQKILDMLPSVDKDTYQTTTRIEGMLSVALEETLESSPDSRGLPSPTATTDGRNDPAAVDEYPFFFVPPVLSKVIHCVTPHENAIRGALRHLGYRCTRSHTKGGSIKTDAPWSVIWDVMREWVKQKSPIKDGALKEGSAGWRIMKYDELEKGSNSETGPLPPQVGVPQEERRIVFDEELGKEKDVKKLVRYQVNPRENWGPMNRARGK